MVWNTQNSSPVWGKCCMRNSVQDFKLLKKYYRSLYLKRTRRNESLIIHKLWIRFIKYESNPGILSIHHQWVCYDMKNNNKLQHEMSLNSIKAFKVDMRIESYFGIVLPFKEQFFLVPLLGQHSVGITNRLAPLYFYRGLLCLN